jgi:NAD(P)-dependent dehydrogenase (short-subunit alcohol dehydrogenase family)
MEMFSLDDRIAFVTGAGSGIGQGIAIGLAKAGADVALFDLPGSQGLEDTARAIGEHGRRSIKLNGNVTDADALIHAVERTEADLGPLSLAVNCAGIANATPAEEMPLDRWRTMLDVNLTGVFLSCRAEGRAMLKRQRGAIVNIASMSGSIVNRGLAQAHYNTSKAGVIHLTKSLAMEWVGRGVRVNSISPGYTMTPMNKRPEVAEQ